MKQATSLGICLFSVAFVTYIIAWVWLEGVSLNVYHILINIHIFSSNQLSSSCIQNLATLLTNLHCTSCISYVDRALGMLIRYVYISHTLRWNFRFRRDVFEELKKDMCSFIITRNHTTRSDKRRRNTTWKANW